MLEYEWGGNPSTIILSAPGDDPPSHEDNQTDPNRHFFHPSTAHNDSFNGPQDNHLVLHNPQPPSALYHQQHTHQVNPFFDPRAYTTTPTSFLSLDHHNHLAHSSSNFFLIPKAEEPTTEHFTSRIGLNLGGRTYFSSAEDDFVNRLYRRSRPLIDPSGSTSSSVINVPRCQADGCNADLTHAKHYHRRHKVCEFHSKASTVIAHGLTQRFCQQCSRFHLLSEFDNGKRSCRKRLADHNRRRRKSNQTNQEISRRSPQPASARNSPPDNLTRSPPDSGAHSSSSVTAALSPPRMSLDCFKHRPYQPPTTTSLTTGSSSSASSSSLFFPSG